MSTNLITKTKENLESVLESNGSKELNGQLLESMASKLKYDASLFLDPETGNPSDIVITTLLPLSIDVLKLSAIHPLTRLDTLVELVAALLAPKSLSQVLNYISANDLLTAVESVQVPALQSVAIQQISKANSSDLAKNPEFVVALVTQLADKNVESSSQSIESCLKKVINTIGPDVSKYLFAGKAFEILNQMWNSNNAILIGRLMEVAKDVVLLDTVESSSSSSSSYDTAKTQVLEFFKFPSSTFNPEKWDSLFVASIIQMYRQIFASPNRPPSTILLDSQKGLSTQLQALGTLFQNRKDLLYIEVRTLLLSDIVGTFAALSRSDDKQIVDFFRQLDTKYEIMASVTDENQRDAETEAEKRLLLTMLSPAYLMEYYPYVLKALKFNASNVSALRNLLSYSPSFEFIAPQQSDFINGLYDYNDKMFVLGGILINSVATHTLLKDWPQVMNLIIDPEFPVTSPDAVTLRRNVLEKLVDLPANELGMWYGGVKEAYREMVFGRPVVGDGPGVAVAQKTM